MNNPTSAGTAIGLSAALKPAPDMASHWSDVDTTYEAAADKLVAAHANDGELHDLPILDLRAWGVVPARGQFALSPLAKHRAPHALRANAFSNLLGRLNAPVDFVRDRLPAPLQLATLNWLLAERRDPMSATLRVRGEEVTAIVSERYAALDQVELVDVLRDALRNSGALDTARVRAVATGLVDVVRVVFPAEEAPIKVGDTSMIGLDISTSSFGRSALHVRGIVWRLACLNGLRVAEKGGGFSLRHVGDVRRLREGLGEAVPAALVQARGLMNRWREAVHVMVDDVAAMIESLHELHHGEKKLVVERVKKEAQTDVLPESIDLYRLVNALTGAAHDAAPGRRLELEAMAGDVLERHTGRAS